MEIINKEMAEKIFQYLTKGVEVVNDQAIELINQIIAYKIFINSAMFIIFAPNLVVIEYVKGLL